jgi:hypothetical protein
LFAWKAQIMKKLQSLQGRTAASGKKCAQKPPDQKRRGEMGEAAFLLKASALGFGVAKPWGDSERYDFIVDVAGSPVESSGQVRPLPQQLSRQGIYHQLR